MPLPARQESPYGRSRLGNIHTNGAQEIANLTGESGENSDHCGPDQNRNQTIVHCG